LNCIEADQSERNEDVRQSHQKDEEHYCAQALKEYLESQGRKVSFKRGKQDPPDFWFSVDEAKWAVEHTRILSKSGSQPGETEAKAISVGKRIISIVTDRYVAPPECDYSWNVGIIGLVPQRDFDIAISSILNAIAGPEMIALERSRTVYRTSPRSEHPAFIMVRRQTGASTQMINPVYEGAVYIGGLGKLANQAIRETLLKKKTDTDIVSIAREMKGLSVLLFDGVGIFTTADIISLELKRISKDEPALIDGIDGIFLVRRYPFPFEECVSSVYGDL